MEAPTPPKILKLSESEEEQEKVIKLLEERLERHDENRKAVQGKIKELYNKLTEQIDGLEEKINRELDDKFTSEDSRLQRVLNELHENRTDNALQKAKVELLVIQSYEVIKSNKYSNDLTTLYELKTEKRNASEEDSVEIPGSEEDSSASTPLSTTEKGEITCGSNKPTEEHDRLIKMLEEHIENHDNNRKTIQDKLHEICERLRTQVSELENRIGKDLEEKFTSEDNRLQAALNELRGNSTTSALQKAKAELLIGQSYEVIENRNVVVEEEIDYFYGDEDDISVDDNENDAVGLKLNLSTPCKLRAERRIVLELIDTRKPTDVRVASVNRGRISVEFTCFNTDEERVLSDNAIVNPVRYKSMLFKKGDEQKSKKECFLDEDEDNDSSSSFIFTPDILETETPYGVRVKMVIGNREYEWSDISEFTTPEFKGCCVWKKCPGDVDDKRKYSVGGGNPRVATKVDSSYSCTIIGNISISLNAITQWSIKVLKSRGNDGDGINIGIAQNDINQNVTNCNRCGWYFYCYSSTLFSGPPHNYRGNEYGPRKVYGQYVHTGDSVGVVMDTTNGDLSFVLDGVNYGVAYEGIPLDKPLVPCVLLYCQGDSVELDISEVKETKVDSSIPVPPNVVVKSTTWDSITLTWNEVADASFYQVEVNGSISCGAPITNSFIKRGFLPETEHSFRVRAVRGSSVGKWSGVVKGGTLKVPEFPECVWKTCPDYVDDSKKYSVDEKNPRVATKINDGWCCTIIRNISISLNAVTPWNVKILKSEKNNGDRIYIGIAPNDINQNEDNYKKCGWYFYCYSSTLWSGPPHNYSWPGKEYGPRKGDGKYVHTGDTVGVVVDTTKGDLSFVLNGVNLGVAFEGVPLDKPLIPCVLLGVKGDSVELDTSEVKETAVDSSVLVPSNITTRSIMWDTITLIWDEVSDASFYQIEVDGKNSWDATTTNTITKRGLLPETEHSFRVRTVRGSSVGKWSDAVKGKTLKVPEFPECVWKKCPDNVDNNRKYSVDWMNPRIATIDGDDRYCNNYSTIIGNTHIPPNTVTRWSIKVLKSKENDGDGINIGVAPFNINQNGDNCNGWYFDCYFSTLRSGPPHNYGYPGKKYGPRKRDGQYVHTGDSVGVVVDTAKGELSFVLNGVDYGVAYEGIPLDKPLVPCVLLGCQGDSVELDFSRVKENVNRSIHVPSNITTRSIMWDSITLAWDEVTDVSFYQIEVDGSRSWDASITNEFTKRGLLPETEHNFRVRTVRGSSVSEWSGVVKEKVSKEIFEASWWKKCPDYVDYGMLYHVDYDNPRIAAKINNIDYECYWCTVIGNTCVPLNVVSSWNIKILKSMNNDGSDIYIGIAPNDINQNNNNNNKCGWYFSCYSSTLWSGPPHNYRSKEYGPGKSWNWGEYVHTGDSVGVVVDTTRGELSFVLNGVNYDVAYGRIPLDKPLVPCVVLERECDSVELVI